MPKLPKKMAKAVANTEPSTGGDFPLMDPGWYYVQLQEVEALDGNYAPRWNVVLHNIHKQEEDKSVGEKQSGKQWLNINIPDDGPAPANYTNGDKKWAAFQSMSKGQLAMFFEGFGYSADSDTDEMLGEWALAKIGIRTIQRGDRKGEKTNEVKQLVPVPDDFEAPDDDEGSDETF